MDSQGKLASALAAVHSATLDDTLWPRTSALIDEAVGITGNALVVGEGHGDDVRIVFGELYFRGQRDPEKGRDYLENYYFRDERLPRLRQVPYGRAVHVTTLYSAEEIRTSPTYNEYCLRNEAQNSLMVRVRINPQMHLTWSIHDPVRGGAWQSDQVDMIESLLPHIRQFVRVRQVMAAARALRSSVSGLLDNQRVGVIQLDRRGRILEANDRALKILRQGDRLCDRNSSLEAWLPADNVTFQKLLAGALPPLGGQAAAGSMTLRRVGDGRRLMVSINPVEAPPLDFGGRRVAALVLLKEPRGERGSMPER